MNILPEQYARALLALDTSEEERIKREGMLEALEVLIKHHRDFRAYVLHPDVSRSKKFVFLKKALDDSTARFVLLLLDHHALEFLPKVHTSYKSLRDSEEGYERVQVTTPYPLSAVSRKEITAKMSTLLGKKIRLYESVHSALLGGCQITFQNTRIDTSVQKEIDQFRKQFSLEAR